ncbi:ABC transporter substrate-binding protein [Phenylobacterium sp. 20VBR1]|uniref:ABC transporter substrate-binding protein n=1 Tax=Phenylobacterium glaciei TaxID=2803784 RepID=A0A941D2M5_9CAUL|nr:ABC transporter substrate-binding protein [Phenylobacterium glaciei]
MRPAPARRHVLMRLGGAVALAGMAAAAMAQPAARRSARDLQAEAFVEVQAQKVLSVLADRGLSLAQKQQAFRKLIDQIADVPKITNFVLGKYARTITPAQRAKFNTVFRAYAESVYQSRISEFRGETLRVSGSVARAAGDVVVNTLVVGGGRDPIPVSWRVLGSGAAWKIVDVQIRGVWLAITQQQDFVSTIDNAGGDIGVLIAQLQRNTRT